MKFSKSSPIPTYQLKKCSFYFIGKKIWGFISSLLCININMHRYFKGIQRMLQHYFVEILIYPCILYQIIQDYCFLSQAYKKVNLRLFQKVRLLFKVMLYRVELSTNHNIHVLCMQKNCTDLEDISLVFAAQVPAIPYRKEGSGQKVIVCTTTYNMYVIPCTT